MDFRKPKLQLAPEEMKQIADAVLEAYENR